MMMRDNVVTQQEERMEQQAHCIIKDVRTDQTNTIETQTVQEEVV